MRARSLSLAVALSLLACEDDRGPRPDAAAALPVDGSIDVPADVPADSPTDVPADVPEDIASDTFADAPTIDAGAERVTGCGPAGNVCVPSRCEGDHFVPESVCDGQGTCVPSSPIACNPTRCRNGTCLTACTSDDDCLAPARCRFGSCGGPRSQDCTHPSQCASGFCVEGVCCDRACTSPCESCALPPSRGKCSPRPRGFQPDAGCAPDGGLADGA